MGREKIVRKDTEVLHGHDADGYQILTKLRKSESLFYVIYLYVFFLSFLTVVSFYLFIFLFEQTFSPFV